MSLISWNCQGIGRSDNLTIPRLEEMRKKHFSEMLFLMETLKCRNELVDIQEWLGYDRVYTVEPVGRSGGLALFWKSSVNIDFLVVNKNLLDMQVQFGALNFFLSCVYGEPVVKYRAHLWEKISRIGVVRKDRWYMLGDFNDILHNGEKLGGPRRDDSVFQPFGNMINACEMEKLPSQGDPYTWGGVRYNQWIQSKLDRCFGNKEWFKQFPASNQTFMDKRGSDHKPVLVKLMDSQLAYKGQFRFDKRFLFKEDVKEAIKAAWKPGVRSFNFSVSDRLKAVRKSLSRWKQKNNTNSRDKIQVVEANLELEQSARIPNFWKINGLKRELIKEYWEEELYWRLRSKDLWLKGGDQNSKFFHASVKFRRSRKRLEKILDEKGVFQFYEAAKGQVATEYFNKLFKSSNPASFQGFFQNFNPKVTSEVNAQLCKEVTNEEIKEAAFAVQASSAPGPDGMSGLFFQHHWETIQNQLSEEVKHFFDSGCMPKEWNYTHICLIPKTNHPTEMCNLRPISLCSVMYKIISKILVRRLQPFLQALVGETQSPFVSERFISDNILIAHEMVHGLKNHPQVSKECIAIKSNMSKAYDIVEWGYLRELLKALGFDEKWILWVMACVTSVTFSMLINDQAHSMIIPQRGLRQGDPLSPFLFFLCTEGLSHLLKQAELEGKVKGISFSEEGPIISHLLFADDSLFLCKADEEQCINLKDILRRYERATGQAINVKKSSITFGKKVEKERIKQIQEIFGIYKEGGTSSYLGLPEYFQGSVVQILNFIKDKMKDRIRMVCEDVVSRGQGDFDQISGISYAYLCHELL